MTSRYHKSPMYYIYLVILGAYSPEPLWNRAQNNLKKKSYPAPDLKFNQVTIANKIFHKSLNHLQHPKLNFKI